MFALRSRTVRELLLLEGLPLVVALAAAERFFKFRNFTLEALAFLALWAGLRAGYLWLLPRLGAGSGGKSGRALSMGGLAYVELPPLAAALLVAGALFKFGSFLREALAFLALWYVLSAVYAWLLAWLSRRTRSVPAPEQFVR